MRLAICVGLTYVNQDAYDGWDGHCPGCDRDAARFAKLCHAAGFDGVQVLVNAMADSRHVKDAFTAAARDLRRGDLLVLYNSGHGGQQPDEDGDELDGRDETLCWWDGEVIDDRIGHYLSRIRPGIRILFVTDTCNSGTNYRGMARAPRRSTPVAVSTAALDWLRVPLLHFGGCTDGRHSYGDEDGGVFTNALLRAMRRARRPVSYAEWFARAASRMPRYQTPVCAQWGGPSFAAMEALT